VPTINAGADNMIGNVMISSRALPGRA